MCENKVMVLPNSFGGIAVIECSNVPYMQSLIWYLIHRKINASNYFIINIIAGGFPGGSSGKEPTCQCRRHRRLGFDLWVGKIPWRKAWQPTPIFLLGESHGQKSLADYSPQGRRESDMTEATYQAILLLLASLEHMIISQWVSYSRT